MYRCIESFTADGEQFTAGDRYTRVSGDHPVLDRHADKFALDEGGPGSGLRSEIRARFPDEPGRVRTGSELGFGAEQRKLFDRAVRGDRRVIEDGAEFPVPGNSPRRRDTAPNHESREAGLRAIDSLRRDLSPEAGDRLEELVRRDRAGVDSRYIAAISDPDYASAFGKRLMRGEHARDEMTDAEFAAWRRVADSVAERASMTVGTPSEGGFAVPATLDPTVLNTSDGRVNPIRQLASSVTITTDVWQGVSSEGVTASWDPELTEVSEDVPVLEQPEIRPQKLQLFTPFSVEVGADWSTLQQELGQLFTDAKDELEARAFVGGTGTVEPQGLLVGGTLGVTGGTSVAGTVLPGNYYRLQESLPPRFQPKAAFLSSNTQENYAFRAVAEASTTEPKFVAPDRQSILGKPWYEVSHMTTSVAGTTVAYGDIASAYRVVDRIGLTVELVPHLFGASRRPTGQRGLYAYARVGGGVINENAVRRLVTS
jgi:HK97 family phage major capsid protein